MTCDSLLRFKLVTFKVRLLLKNPGFSWQASTKRSIQFDQTLSLLRESLARAYGRPLVTKVNVRSKMVQRQVQRQVQISTSVSTSGSNFTNIQRQVQRQVQISTSVSTSGSNFTNIQRQVQRQVQIST